MVLVAYFAEETDDYPIREDSPQRQGALVEPQMQVRPDQPTGLMRHGKTCKREAPACLGRGFFATP